AALQDWLTARAVTTALAAATGPVTLVVPLGGGSIMDIEGGAFWQPEVNRRCWDALRDGLKKEIRYREVDAHINQAAFAEAALDELLRLIG
ncbi:MAG: Tm-1-like ATP-binding domain-containing protein, partial [Anaerolineae bacterium]|nr:Tm-1-like ATP-binding domain-containing protein [Anaerolineae bacterium]